MPYDRLAYTLRLRSRRSKALQLLQCHEPSVPFKAHMRLFSMVRRSSQVMVQACQSPSLEEAVSRVASDPFGEVLGHYCMTKAVDAEGVVVGLFGQSLLHGVLGFLDDLCRGPYALEIYRRSARLCIRLGWDV